MPYCACSFVSATDARADKDSSGTCTVSSDQAAPSGYCESKANCYWEVGEAAAVVGAVVVKADGGGRTQPNADDEDGGYHVM